MERSAVELMARAREMFAPKAPPMRMVYQGYDVTGLVPEDASAGDPEFKEWSGRADQYIALAAARGWSREDISSGLREVVKYPHRPDAE